MLEGKLIIIPALGHQNKDKSSFTGSGLFVLMSQCGNNNELALQHGGFCTTWSLVAKGLFTHSKKSTLNWKFCCQNSLFCFRQQLVKEMVEADVELMKSNPSAWALLKKFSIIYSLYGIIFTFFCFCFARGNDYCKWNQFIKVLVSATFVSWLEC